MATVSSTVWNDVLGHFRLNHPQLARGWFAALYPSSLDGAVMRIQTCNEAQSRYLDQHCRRAFSEAAQAATGRLLTVAFETTDSAADSVATQTWATPSLLHGLLPLNADFTFDHFMTGPSNRLAHAAALAIAKDPGHLYNPFFVHGAVGLGKTHLLQAVCHALLNGQASASYHYISCETFINDFIEAVENGGLHQFRYRYRHANVLVIDDVQFLAERERSQEEFFHTFNTLHQSHRQIILSADCPPSDIPSLEERLVSRFNSGLVALIDRPCLETRIAIVRNKAKLRCLEVPKEVAQLVASRIDTNMRELEGALTKIDALSQTLAKPITTELALDALGPGLARPVTIPAILATVGTHFNVKLTDLQGKKRSKAITQPRHICMYIARRLTSHSLEEIGGYFGGRDHSTVLHASRAITRLVDSELQFRELVDNIIAELKDVTQ